MIRYFFDIRDDGYFYPDEEGLELTNLRDAKVEAAHTMADIARDAGRSGDDHDVTVEVRTNQGLLFQAAFVFHGTKQ
ncbi:DUF6894 family protein [Bradyrhizobium sp. Ce-3]|uniref:DUF6894 family protein n=1 Tax=Bradyrhizobium sp. Ce-3 TaxID=2913970 RepID=UPI001FBA87D9|nr:hypothetical protein [Bradyrhizobium sp. Ce-3]GKQ49942.1 hypothetical protein BRSPCE3_07970 [Bradyrhizobium sp. Ce-3]